MRIATELGSSAQSLWLADGINYAGQDDLAARHERIVACLGELYAVLPPEQELLVEYKFFEPAFYATDIADWGSALLICERLGERARVLVDLGHHAMANQRRADRRAARAPAAASAAFISTIAATRTTT